MHPKRSDLSDLMMGWLWAAVWASSLASAPADADAAPPLPEGSGQVVELLVGQTWQLAGWRTFQKTFEMDGPNQVFFQVAPEAEVEGFRIAVATARTEALISLGDHMAERTLLDSYLRRLFFKLGATPERITGWECTLKADPQRKTPDPNVVAFGLQGELLMNIDLKGWWRSCMAWDRQQGTLLVALAWQEGADQPADHPLALFRTVLLHTKLTDAAAAP